MLHAPRRQSKTFLRGYEQCLGKARGHGRCWLHLATVWDEDQSAERRFSPFRLEGPPQRKGEARAEQDRGQSIGRGRSRTEDGAGQRQSIGLKRPPIDRSQRFISIHNLKVAIMSNTGCVLAFESAIFGQFQSPATGDVAALSTQHPVRSAKLGSVWARLVHFWESFF